MARGTVVALHLKSSADSLEPVDELVAVSGEGFEGDVHRGRARRQVLFVATDQLEAFGYAPGTLREQITVELPGLQQLPLGTLVRVGEASFEITMDCDPCTKMALRLGEEPEAFKQKLDHRRGMLAVVRDGGTIRVGDEVLVASG
ncbi:MAG: MOSC domain-containing protein [Chthonomonadaceae bacterium]|nr:MOSC domain-containing protein [Chthonomonadaceae bacterium]